MWGKKMSEGKRNGYDTLFIVTDILPTGFSVVEHKWEDRYLAQTVEN